MSDADDLVRTGRVWKFGDQINTDVILPSAAFRLPQSDQHKLVFEALRPGWAAMVNPGDIIVGGHNFGLGSGRPVGAVLRACGIAGLVAESINGLCLRSCVNYSLPGINCAGVSALFEEGDSARIDFLSGRVENLTRGGTLIGQPLVTLLADIVTAGGVIPMLIREGWLESTPYAAPVS
jgi:3-isopropylmalate/(R)-2-methylmalate dehydratase small subunit